MLCYAETLNSLYVVDSNGSYTEMQFADNPTVRFDGTKLLVSSEAASLEFNDETVKVTTTKPLPGVIDLVNQGSNMKCTIHVHKGKVEIAGLHPGSPINVYTIDGVLISSEATDANGYAAINIPVENQTVIIVTSSQSFKVIAR